MVSANDNKHNRGELMVLGMVPQSSWRDPDDAHLARF